MTFDYPIYDLYVVAKIPNEHGITLILIYDSEYPNEHVTILIYDIINDVIVLKEHEMMIAGD